MALSAPLPARLAIDKLNADLLAIQRETEKELSKVLREGGNKVRDKVRGSTKPPFRTGKTRRGVKTSVRRKLNVSLYSNEPQADVLHWGGAIYPRGKRISFPRTEFITQEVLDSADDFEEEVAEGFDRIVHNHGFFG